MERFMTDAQTGLRHELKGDYYLIAGKDAAELPPVGIWGRRHLRWLQQNRRATYTNLLTTGKLYDYLQEIDAHAYDQLDLLIRQMVKAEGVTEQMKAGNQMEWVRRMNSIRNRAEEIIRAEMIYN